MTTKQKLELMNEIDRRNAQRIAEHLNAVKPEAQTLVEHGIIATVMNEIELWREMTTSSIKIIQDEIAAEAIAN